MRLTYLHQPHLTGEVIAQAHGMATIRVDAQLVIIAPLGSFARV